MKLNSFTLTGIAFLGLLSGAGAQGIALLDAEAAETAAEVGTLPQQRAENIQRYLIDPEVDRNPFASRTKGSKDAVGVDTQSEESRIRAALQGFSVSGIAKGGAGFKAQLGTIILEEGEVMPRLLVGQSDDLRVTKITHEQVEITWVGDEDADNPRQIFVTVDLEPVVGVVLPTAATKGSAGTRGALVYQRDGEEEEKD